VKGKLSQAGKMDGNVKIQSSANEWTDYPLLPIRDTVMFPYMVTPLFVGRDRSVRAVEAASKHEDSIIVVTQKDADVLEPSEDELYHIGTEVSIGRVLRMPDGSTSILGQGKRRVRIVEFVQFEPYLRVKVEPIDEPKDIDLPTEALMRAVLALFEKCVQLSRTLPEDAYVAAMNIDEPGWLADLVASVLELPIPERQEILETFDPTTRLQRLSIILARELDVLELEAQIHDQVQQEVDRSQREFFLREQMKVIQTELGEMDNLTEDISEIREKLGQIEMSEEARKKADKELKRLISMPAASPEAVVARTYLDWLIELPWNTYSEDSINLSSAAKILDNHHYGLPKAKERILEYIAVRKLAAEKMRSPILCFVGPPGTGKTSLGKSIAEALGREFVRVSLGGIRDEAEIRGHRRTYVGALPGRIIQTMRKAGMCNPVFMLDEIDKIGIDFRGDPSSALLEVLDPEQNNAFSDHYLEINYDLSKAMFITTANMLDTVPPALRDRMEVIEFPGYIEEEKLHIARQFLIPKQLEENGLKSGQVQFSDGVLREIIREYTYEAGVRNLEREVANICRKAARKVAEGKRFPARLSSSSLNKYLGPPQFSYGLKEERDEVGVATGMAWTETGGDLMPIEVSLMRGKGTLMLTGQLGEIMQESAQAALSYARSHAKELGIKIREFDKYDIHIHIPEGAIPKDGPSAGITMATALISALTRRPVRHDIAMTGEITLRGRVLTIGGLREKAMAAHRAGLRTIIVPSKNKKDLVEMPKKVRKDLEFVFVDRMDEVLPLVLTQEPPRRTIVYSEPDPTANPPQRVIPDTA
jgi:ATP-dependent Lon protease